MLEEIFVHREFVTKYKININEQNYTQFGDPFNTIIVL